MAQFSDEQWLWELNLPEGDINTRVMAVQPPEKTLLDHINGVTECMKKFVSETELVKARQDAQDEKLKAIETQITIIVNNLMEMQLCFNKMRETLKEVGNKDEPSWQIETPAASGAGDEAYGPFEMAQ